MHFDSLKGWLDWQETLHPKSIDLGLERVSKVFARLNPQAVKPVTITVAGTNGKGSSIAFLEAIYRAQGIHVGAYTSPHIIDYNERIKVNGIAASDELICASFERIEAVRDNISLSYFEFSTLAALDIFARANVEIQLLEVGLGGRLDAVNIVDADACIITSISIDHTSWLGETREEIAFEKAGILRSNIAAIIGDSNPPQSLINYAEEIQAPLLRIDHEFSFKKSSDYWSWHNQDTHIATLPTPLLKGEHQYRNASSVLAAIQTLQNKIPVSVQAIKHGISHVNLPGRFQLIPSKPDVLLDVSHNPQAAQALIKYLQAEFNQIPIHAVFTMMNDKDLAGVIKLMQPAIKHWYISPLDNPRNSKSSDLLDAFSLNQITQLSTDFKDFISAFQAARVGALADNGIILIFGSFFLVSEYLSLFSKNSDNKSQGKEYE